MSLELKDVQKSYREPGGSTLPVLNIPHFRLQQGEQVALLGQSGGGKTTLLNVIAGITAPDRGHVLIDGFDITRLVEPARDQFRAERIGIVFQTFHLLQAFTALENVLLGMTFSGKPNPAYARKLLERVGLSQRMHHRPKQLSVGEQQRVSVARALANRPRLMLADEPTASVDIANQETILKLLTETCEEFDISLLLVTHSPEVSTRFKRVEQLNSFNQAGSRQ
ncbi:ABC transporter ATP-binding protein [Planctomicrobium sp. SH664]|uniref:ABC transporter ATP-binding protein n=1 Tax=Planctomicrobium sp. SH664 TaxID=3448125 RepID=UPI003F5C1ABA